MGGWWGQYSFRCQPVDYSPSSTATRVSALKGRTYDENTVRNVLKKCARKMKEKCNFYADCGLLTYTKNLRQRNIEIRKYIETKSAEMRTCPCKEPNFFL